MSEIAKPKHTYLVSRLEIGNIPLSSSWRPLTPDFFDTHRRARAYIGDIQDVDITPHPKEPSALVIEAKTLRGTRRFSLWGNQVTHADIRFYCHLLGIKIPIVRRHVAALYEQQIPHQKELPTGSSLGQKLQEK